MSAPLLIDAYILRRKSQKRNKSFKLEYKYSYNQIEDLESYLGNNSSLTVGVVNSSNQIEDLEIHLCYN